MINCFVTGANGFVGSTVVNRLNATGRFSVGAAVRRVGMAFPPGVSVCSNLDLSAATDWMPALAGVDCVVHTAARVHVRDDIAADSLEKFREINVEGTINLARQSALAGVSRFVFISSIKVNGEGTTLGHSYMPDDMPAPADPYGISKREAEDALRQLAAISDMKVVIIRPPLVYGPGVKANFRSMMRWLRRGVPLPFGAIHNKRSLVSLDNLVDLIITCIEHPAAVNETFLVSDGEDMSTTELLRRMGGALGKPARLWAVPAWILLGCAAVSGKRALSQRLCGSLQVDISKARDLLGWLPSHSVDEGLSITARDFLKTEGLG